jgi:phosphatidylserine/phosphatidylglycerophosphate/cardiolipin synthase-like enzyme
MKYRRISHSRFCVLFFILILVTSSCAPAIEGPVAAITVIPATSQGIAFQVYFSDPTSPTAYKYEGGPDHPLALAIDAARLSVDMAAYSLNLWSIRDALIRAHRRGVMVRMVMESDNMDSREVQDLKDAGIQIIGDRRAGLMHNKFVVIDRSEVWTGSLNYTVSGAYRDNNNLLCIDSVQAARDYTSEFDEMYEQDVFGGDVINTTHMPPLEIKGYPIEIKFSPDDGVANRIIELIRSAQDSIYFMAYSFTSDDIGKVIIQRAQAGVRVAGVMDTGQILSNQGTEYDKFVRTGLDVRKSGIDGLMHHKVIIIDAKIVITGSYNFTFSAETNNDENIVIIFDPNLAAQYLQEFNKVQAEAVT